MSGLNGISLLLKDKIKEYLEHLNGMNVKYADLYYGYSERIRKIESFLYDNKDVYIKVMSYLEGLLDYSCLLDNPRDPIYEKIKKLAQYRGCRIQIKYGKMKFYGIYVDKLNLFKKIFGNKMKSPNKSNYYEIDLRKYKR